MHFYQRADSGVSNGMKNFFLGFACILLIVFAFSFLWAAEHTLAPDFKLEDTAGAKTFTLSSYKDKQPVLLFFWTTWCPFCRKELETLNKMYPGLLKENLAVLAIDVGESPQRVNNFLNNFKLDYNVLLDRDTKVASAFELLGVPTYILIDRKGYIVFSEHSFPYKYKDLVDLSRPDLEIVADGENVR